MNALELLAKLEESGTGAEKMHRARNVARDMGRTLRAMDAEELVGEMEARQRRRLDLMGMGGPRRERLALPPELAEAWGEETLAKARRILQGLDAVPKTAAASAVYDVDEEPGARPEGEGEHALGVPNPAGPETQGGDDRARPAKPDHRPAGKDEPRPASRLAGEASASEDAKPGLREARPEHPAHPGLHRGVPPGPQPAKDAPKPPARGGKSEDK